VTGEVLRDMMASTQFHVLPFVSIRAALPIRLMSELQVIWYVYEARLPGR